MWSNKVEPQGNGFDLQQVLATDFEPKSCGYLCIRKNALPKNSTYCMSIDALSEYSRFY